MNISESYFGIFGLVPEMCKIVGVARVGKTENESNDNVFEFVATVVAPTRFPDIEPTPNECVKINNYAIRRLDGIAGPDIFYTVNWKTKDKDDNEGKGRFDFSIHLIPSAVRGFEIKDGMYQIKVQCFGTFY